MIVISPIQESILKGLGRYKFLTSHQTWKLIGNKNIQTIYNDLRTLKERGFVDCIVYGGVTKSGTMTKLYYLTTKGAKLCADIEGVLLDLIKFPKSTNTLVKNDFFHRIFTIDLMVSFDIWLADTEHEPVFFDVYFDKTGSQRKQDDGALKGKTRVDIGGGNFIDPDAIFMYSTKQKYELCILEIANGLDTKRIIQQIRNVVFGAYQGLIAEKYIHEKQKRVMPKILIALEHESTMQSVVKRIKNDEYLSQFEALDEYLFFSLQPAAKDDWSNNWLNTSLEKANIWH